MPTRTTLPKASQHTVAVGSAAGPVSVNAVPGSSAPADVTVSVLDQQKAAAAGVAGVLLQVTPAGAGGGKVRLGVDYGDWAQAYGGNYAGRLRLIAYPSCVLTTPADAKCRRGDPLPTTNNVKSQTLAADLKLTASATPMVLAAATGSGDDGGGTGGSYGAGTLKPEGSWNSGGSTGSFTYGYPIATPAATTGLAPQLALSYDSAAVDGETATTQAQASMVGDGWSIPRSYIEQSFASCTDNPEGSAAPNATQDQCYGGPILTMSLNGATTSLVLDKSGVWKTQNDHGAVIKHLTSTNNGTATYNTDQWTVTERDGTVYTFGMNHLPGWTSGKAATNSVDYEPVYSAHDPSTPGKGWTDPCFNKTGTGFANSVCTMAYRWNLDYVKDLHGAAMAYYYTQKTNAYGQNNGATTGTYVRDSYLDHVDYGFTDGNAYGTVPDQVVFNNGNRCVDNATACASLDSSTKAHWPDVPFDLICSSNCAANKSPSMFSTARLTSIVTQQYSAATSGYLPVDTYTLGQTIPAINGNATTPTLWLASITHTGNDLAAAPGETGNAAITLPPTTFTPVASALPNRIDTSVLPAFYRNRLATITTEAGAQISVSYSLAKPCAVPVKLDPANNNTSCFPVSWTPAGYTAPILDWFAKYSVDQVTEHSPTGGSPDVTTSYTYDKPAWHYDDNELIKAKYRTYGQFRGFRDVKTFLGDGNTDRRTENETVFYQGMSKNHNDTAVTIPDSQGGQHEDLDQLAGNALETIAYQGENGPVDHSTITSYWVSAPTATRSRTGLSDLVATSGGPAETFVRQAVTSGSATTWRYLETDNSYDDSITSPTFGLLQRVYSHTVPAQAAYDTCASTVYAAVNADENLVGLTAESEADSVACGGFSEGSKPSVPASTNSLTAPQVNRPAQVVADTRTFYDDTQFDTTFPQAKAPTTGDVTMTQRASGYSGNAFQYQPVSKMLYDSFGRVTKKYDGRNNSVSMAYTTSSIGLTTADSVTDAMGHVTTTTYDPARAAALTSTDPNGIVTTIHSDSLGRITSVWKYSRTTSQPANNIYSYTIQNDGTAAVTTKTMNDQSGYMTSTVLDDALLRPRQTQSMTPLGGRMVTDTLYDTRGWVSMKNNGWWDSKTTPNTTLVQPRDINQPVPSQDTLTYDGLGRVITDTKEADYNPVAGQITTTVYNGDRTTVIPPAGGSVQTTIVDPMGRTTELDQYSPTNPSVTAPSDTFTGHYTVTPAANTVQPTLYGYDQHGNQSTITQGLGGPTWTTTFNLLGQVINKIDPDAGNTDINGSGTASMRYDGNGNVIQTSDSAGRTVSYTYDALNRKTGVYDSDADHQTPGAAGNQARAWIYDNSNNAATMNYAVGKLTTEVAYWDHQPYTVQQKNFTIFGGSTGETVTVPAEAPSIQLGTSYTFTHTYTPTTGLPSKDTYPAAGGLPAETTFHGYSYLDLPVTLGSDLTGYLTGTSYDAWGRITQSNLGVTPRQAVVTNIYDLTLDRLTESNVTRRTGTPAVVDDQTYSYDPAGNLIKQVSTRLNSSATSETRCYGYTSLDQLATAWTATDSCAATPTASDSSMVGDNLGTSSAYWTSWTIDAQGDRTTQTQHGFTGGPTADSTTNYTYNGNGAGQPHTLTATSTTGGGSTSYRYDKTGNMIDRNAAQGDQTLTYDNLDELTQISGGSAGSTSYRYDPEGNLLLQHDPTGTVLYLPGEQITLSSSGAMSGVRYIGLPGGAVAVRTGTAAGAFSFELGDQHGTPNLYLDNTAQTPTWRQFTPYGEPRGPDAAVPDNRAFLNKTLDPSTGLTSIGAREYDPVVGRFVTLDPVLNAADPGQLNGYAYTSGNPIGESDPTGLNQMPDTGGGCGGAAYWNQFSMTCEFVSDNEWHDPSHISSIMDGIGNALKEMEKGIVKVNVDETKCVSGRGCGDVKQDAKGVARQMYALHNCASLYISACKEVLASIGCGKFDGNCIGHIIFFIATAALTEGAGEFVDAADVAVLGAGTATDAATATATDAAAATGDAAGAADGAIASKAESLVEGCNSFTPETGVLLADGSTEPISDVKVGDKVIATDPVTGKAVEEPVTLLHDNVDHDFIDLTVSANGHTSTIHTTNKHPFWDESSGKWVFAGDLKVGDRLHNVAGMTVTVERVHAFTGERHMLNLTVDQIHTYYVMAGNAPVLVHNDAGGPGENPEIFPNLFPKDGGYSPGIPTDLLRRRSGNYQYVVQEDGTLVVGKGDGHTMLARGGAPVRAAGEVRLRSGQITELNNLSGHYQPYGSNAASAAEKAFNDAGFDATGKYVARYERGQPLC